MQLPVKISPQFHWAFSRGSYEQHRAFWRACLWLKATKADLWREPRRGAWGRHTWRICTWCRVALRGVLWRLYPLVPRIEHSIGIHDAHAKSRRCVRGALHIERTALCQRQRQTRTPTSFFLARRKAHSKRNVRRLHCVASWTAHRFGTTASGLPLRDYPFGSRRALEATHAADAGSIGLDGLSDPRVPVKVLDRVQRRAGWMARSRTAHDRRVCHASHMSKSLLTLHGKRPAAYAWPWV